MESSQKKLIKALTTISIKKRNKINALPKRARSEATEVLNSNEILHLAKHIVKITLWPSSSYVKGWLKEIKASLDNLAFGLSKSSKRIENIRYIEDLWYSADTLMKKINIKHDSAYWGVIKEMESKVDSIEQDPFNENMDLLDIGYSIREEKDKKRGITFALWLNNEKIV